MPKKQDIFIKVKYFLQNSSSQEIIFNLVAFVFKVCGLYSVVPFTSNSSSNKIALKKKSKLSTILLTLCPIMVIVSTTMCIIWILLSRKRGNQSIPEYYSLMCYLIFTIQLLGILSCFSYKISFFTIAMVKSFNTMGDIEKIIDCKYICI